MIKTAIIDDEPNNVRSLVALLQKYCPEVNITGTADSPETGYELITNLKPELVLLDIKMSSGNAFDMLDRLMPIDFEVIFVTAFDSYAITAFHYAALDYLLKPVSIKDLDAAIQKAIVRVAEKTTNQKIANLLQNLREGDTKQKKIAISDQNGLVFVGLDTIVYLEANKSYTTLYLSNKHKIVASKALGSFEEMLPPESFSRIHHSYIVNHDFVKRYHAGRGGHVEMEDGFTIEVSVRKKEMFLSKFIR
jgi:two-component system LytT family response regulator